MALPTTYLPALVEYLVQCEGPVVPATFTVTLNVDVLGESLAEDLAAACEAGLQALGEEFLTVSGIDAVHVNRIYRGRSDSTDIFTS